MPNEKKFESIADALAAAQRQKAEKTAAAMATRKSQTARFGPTGGAGAAPGKSLSPADPVDLRDNFDFAIEAVVAARKSMSHEPAKAEAAAVNTLMEKRQITRAKAVSLVKDAVKYLDC